MVRESFFLITSALFILLTLITIIFALITILIIVYNWKSQTRSITNLLTCNSCFTLLYHSLATLLEILFLSFPVNTILCRIRAYIYYSSCISLSYSYLIHAISRYFITIRYQHKMLLTFHLNWILIVLNWFISAFFGMIMLLIPLALQYEYESRMCLLTSKVFLTSLIGVMIAFCFPFLAIIFLYALILYHTTTSRRHLSVFNTMRLRRNLKVFQMILMFVCILAIGGTPYFICVMMNRVTQIPWPWYSLSILCISLSAALESLALLFSNSFVKRRFLELIHLQQRTDINILIGQHQHSTNYNNHAENVPLHVSLLTTKDNLHEESKVN
ncbi:unnamed protein product [Adineta ricciae]|uniref:G-protein coupled receptors family 1 profile domain-containing protein n=1 Tax=Adineta ricciae TaxID=249248 RepID=A0A814C7Q9_ADIRI|nr:unnamed protein product [Adineta ricciae]CAF1295368.1 unnamed protein product [Adineta ricciae]